MRLIDADAVVEAVEDEIAEAKGIDADPNFVAGLKLGLAYISTAPTVDTEPVVRCRDCKHYTPCGYVGDWGTCAVTRSAEPEYSSCSDGERRADDEAY